MLTPLEAIGLILAYFTLYAVLNLLKLRWDNKELEKEIKALRKELGKDEML